MEKVGGPRRTRTCDPLIKRSLTPPTVDEFRILRVADHGKTMQRVTRIRNPRATRGGRGQGYGACTVVDTLFTHLSNKGLRLECARGAARR